MQPGPNCADGDVQRLGDLDRVQATPGRKEKNVAIAGRQVQQCSREALYLRASIYAFRGARGGVVDVPNISLRDPRCRGQRPPLLPLKVRHQVRGDTEEPRPRLSSFGVEPAPVTKGDQERLRHDVVSGEAPDTAGDVPVQRSCVGVEQRLEEGDRAILAVPWPGVYALSSAAPSTPHDTYCPFLPLAFTRRVVPAAAWRGRTTTRSTPGQLPNGAGLVS